jgi:hypothetical protein
MGMGRREALTGGGLRRSGGGTGERILAMLRPLMPGTAFHVMVIYLQRLSCDLLKIIIPF